MRTIATIILTAALVLGVSGTADAKRPVARHRHVVCHTKACFIQHYQWTLHVQPTAPGSR